MTSKERLTAFKNELKHFRKTWKNMTDMEFNLWVYRLIILYGCYYVKNKSIEIIRILNSYEYENNTQRKFELIDELFREEAEILSKHKVSV